MRLLFLFVGVIFLPVASGQDQPSKRTHNLEESIVRLPEIQLEVSHQEEFMFWAAIGEIKGLVAGKRHRLPLSIHNLSSLPIPINEIETGCACVSFLIKESSILPGETVKAVLTVKARDSARDGQFATQIDFISPIEFQSTRLVIKGELLNNLHIDADRTALKVEPGLTTWRIPFIYSAPVRLKNLEVVKPKAMKDFSAQIVAANGVNAVEISVHSDIFTSEYFFWKYRSPRQKCRH